MEIITTQATEREETGVNIGERVFWLREENGWSQEELGRRSRVARRTIIDVEQGHHDPRPSTLRKLARAFGMTVAELEHGSNEQSREGETAEEVPAVEQ